MDDRQSKLLIGAVALIVLACAAWFFLIKNGTRNGVSDLPDQKGAAVQFAIST